MYTEGWAATAMTNYFSLGILNVVLQFVSKMVGNGVDILSTAYVTDVDILKRTWICPISASSATDNYTIRDIMQLSQYPISIVALMVYWIFSDSYHIFAWISSDAVTVLERPRPVYRMWNNKKDVI